MPIAPQNKVIIDNFIQSLQRAGIKIIVSDFDGTLIANHTFHNQELANCFEGKYSNTGKLKPENRDPQAIRNLFSDPDLLQYLLEKCREEGIIFAIASKQNPTAITSLLEVAGFDLGLFTGGIHGVGEKGSYRGNKDILRGDLKDIPVFIEGNNGSAKYRFMSEIQQKGLGIEWGNMAYVDDGEWKNSRTGLDGDVALAKNKGAFVFGEPQEMIKLGGGGKYIVTNGEDDRFVGAYQGAFEKMSEVGMTAENIAKFGAKINAMAAKRAEQYSSQASAASSTFVASTPMRPRLPRPLVSPAVAVAATSFVPQVLPITTSREIFGRSSESGLYQSTSPSEELLNAFAITIASEKMRDISRRQSKLEAENSQGQNAQFIELAKYALEINRKCSVNGKRELGRIIADLELKTSIKDKRFLDIARGVLARREVKAALGRGLSSSQVRRTEIVSDSAPDPLFSSSSTLPRQRRSVLPGVVEGSEVPFLPQQHSENPLSPRPRRLQDGDDPLPPIPLLGSQVVSRGASVSPMRLFQPESPRAREGAWAQQTPLKSAQALDNEEAIITVIKDALDLQDQSDRASGFANFDKKRLHVQAKDLVQNWIALAFKKPARMPKIRASQNLMQQLELLLKTHAHNQLKLSIISRAINAINNVQEGFFSLTQLRFLKSQIQESAAGDRITNRALAEFADLTLATRWRSSSVAANPDARIASYKKEPSGLKELFHSLNFLAGQGTRTDIGSGRQRCSYSKRVAPAGLLVYEEKGSTGEKSLFIFDEALTQLKIETAAKGVRVTINDKDASLVEFKSPELKAYGKTQSQIKASLARIFDASESINIESAPHRPSIEKISLRNAREGIIDDIFTIKIPSQDAPTREFHLKITDGWLQVNKDDVRMVDNYEEYMSPEDSVALVGALENILADNRLPNPSVSAGRGSVYQFNGPGAGSASRA